MSDEAKKNADGSDSLHELVSCDKPEFIERFEKIQDGLTVRDLAELIWKYGNDRWSNGYTQGKYNPDFD